jgi:hypothetical protein
LEYFVPDVPTFIEQYRVIQLRSTWCEQKLWERIIQTISSDLLFNLAIGNRCVVVDYSAKKRPTRAVGQGLEWLKFVLWLRWYGVRYEPMGRCKAAGKYFDNEYRAMGRTTARRLDYFKTFLNPDGEIRLESECGQTKHDGDKMWYAEIAREMAK